MLGEAFGAIAALKQKGVALATSAKLPFQLARLTCKNQRRIGRQFTLDTLKQLRIIIIGHLQNRHGAPALG